MKYTDTATLQYPILEVITKTEWMAHILKTLEIQNLIRTERKAYKMELARVGSMIAMDENATRIAKEPEQKILLAITNLLNDGSFFDEKIAELLSVNIKQVKLVKKQLKHK